MLNMIKNTLKQVYNSLSLKNLVKLLAFSSLASLAKADRCPGIGLQQLPIECQLPVMSKSSSGAMLNVRLMIAEQDMMTIASECRIHTSYRGQRGASFFVSRESCGRGYDGAKVCDVAKDPTCTSASSQVDGLTRSSSDMVIKLLPYNTSECRQPPPVMVMSSGCSYHDSECVDDTVLGELNIACKSITMH